MTNEEEETAIAIKNAVENGCELLPDYIWDIHEVFCGCGDPVAAWKWITDYLVGLSLKEYRAYQNEPELICFYLMCHLGLTEHGTNINSSWLTDVGTAALAFLCKEGHDWQDKKDWVASNGCCIMRNQ